MFSPTHQPIAVPRRSAVCRRIHMHVYMYAYVSRSHRSQTQPVFPSQRIRCSTPPCRTQAAQSDGPSPSVPFICFLVARCSMYSSLTDCRGPVPVATHCPLLVTSRLFYFHLSVGQPRSTQYDAAQSTNQRFGSHSTCMRDLATAYLPLKREFRRLNGRLSGPSWSGESTWHVTVHLCRVWCMDQAWTRYRAEERSTLSFHRRIEQQGTASILQYLDLSTFPVLPRFP